MTLAFPHLWIPARNILSPAADWLAATSSALRTRPASSAQRNRCGDAAMEMQDPSCCGCAAGISVSFSSVVLAAFADAVCCQITSGFFSNTVYSFDITGALGTYCLPLISSPGAKCIWQTTSTLNNQDLSANGTAPGGCAQGTSNSKSITIRLERDVAGSGVWYLYAAYTSFTIGAAFFFEGTAAISANDYSSPPNITSSYSAFTCANFTPNVGGWIQAGHSGSATLAPSTC